MLSDMLNRLAETAGEQTDELVQGYVTELLLTLDSALVHLEAHEHCLRVDLSSDALSNHSTHGLTTIQRQSGHTRSSSCYVPPVGTPTTQTSPQRNSVALPACGVVGSTAQQLPRSQSAQVRALNIE